MPNYYTEICFKIDDLSPNEHAWFDDIFSIEGYPFDTADGGEQTVAEYLAVRMDREPEEFEEHWYWEDWRDTSDRKHGYVDFYTENGYLDELALVVQSFLRMFRPDNEFILSYAATCSRPVWDGYGGGAIAITADHVQWFDGNSMARDYLMFTRSLRETSRAAAEGGRNGHTDLSDPVQVHG